MKKLLPVLGVVISACALSTADERTASEEQALTGPKVAVMFSSYGDVDSPDEAEDFVKACLRDPDIAPIPDFLRPIVVPIAWALEGKEIRSEYEAIGGAANLRARSRDLAERVAEGMRSRGVNAKGYVGFDFTEPFIGKTLAQMQADGVERLVFIYEGAQYSKVTQYINIRETRKYLNAHPEWHVNAIAIKSFSDDPRFLELLGASIQRRIDADFGGAPPESLCIFLPMHGVPTSLPAQGDPAVDQMMRAVDYVRTRFSRSLVDYGFQNHDEFPFSRWTQPRHDKELRKLAALPRCRNILINGRVSFTVDCLETLYDHAIDERQIASEVNPTAKVTVEPMFNSEPTFVDFMRDISLEALAGSGDIEVLR